MDVSAAVAHKPHEDFSIEPLALDQPREDEVVVEIRGSGICHTDLAARDGAIPIELPAVFGHEGSGVVRSVGGGVSNVKQGDRVTLTFNSCGDCPSCSESQPAYCHMFAALNYAGSRLDGTGALAGSDGGKVGNYFFAQSSFATHAIARARNVVKVDDDLDLELLGPLGCGIQTGAGAVMNSLADRKSVV